MKKNYGLVITKIFGGLGNQMFQYALGKKIALVNNVALKLDVNSYLSQKGASAKREYLLNVFNIQENFASREEIDALRPFGIKRLHTLLLKYFPQLKLSDQTYIRERSYFFDPSVLQITGDVYIEGYWQSEKYFKDSEGLLRKDFTFKKKFDRDDRPYEKKIRESNAISVHVRRGDYVFDKKTYQSHGVCGLDYYRKAANLIAKYEVNPVFFVFSDEPEWVVSHLRFGFPTTYIAHEGADRTYQDMRLMSLCQHHIIANSSFSWWGAWLNPKPDKTVIAPKKWFLDQSINISDLLPSSWLKI